MIKKFCLVLVAICSLFFVSCAKTTAEDCTFLNERVNLHEEYIISVSEIGSSENIFVLKNENDVEASEIIGTTSHYLYVVLNIEHQNVSESKEIHELDANDFKIKDHTGVQIKNITFIESINSSAKSEIDFSTRNAIKDYTWFGKQIPLGTSQEIKLYFEFDNSIDIEKTLMILEVDFFATKKGTDIVLVDRV